MHIPKAKGSELLPGKRFKHMELMQARLTMLEPPH